MKIEWSSHARRSHTTGWVRQAGSQDEAVVGWADWSVVNSTRMEVSARWTVDRDFQPDSSLSRMVGSNRYAVAVRDGDNGPPDLQVTVVRREDGLGALEVRNPSATGHGPSLDIGLGDLSGVKDGQLEQWNLSDVRSVRVVREPQTTSVEILAGEDPVRSFLISGGEILNRKLSTDR
ncbi:MAG: hypothetical protein AB1758_05000 [Candidatus Eremiobacterota bacterium]